jgi:hypothetical protein
MFDEPVYAARDQLRELVTIIQPLERATVSSKRQPAVIDEASQRTNLLLRLQKIKPSVAFKSSSKKAKAARFAKKSVKKFDDKRSMNPVSISQLSRNTDDARKTVTVVPEALTEAKKPSLIVKLNFQDAQKDKVNRWDST